MSSSSLPCPCSPRAQSLIILNQTLQPWPQHQFQGRASGSRPLPNSDLQTPSVARDDVIYVYLTPALPSMFLILPQPVNTRVNQLAYRAPKKQHCFPRSTSNPLHKKKKEPPPPGSFRLTTLHSPDLRPRKNEPNPSAVPSRMCAWLAGCAYPPPPPMNR